MAGYDRALYFNQHEDYMCGICLNVLNNPHQCFSGHTYCYECLKNAAEVNRFCPTCKRPLKVEHLSASLFLKNQISELLVRCYCLNEGQIHDGDICSWSGTMEKREAHQQVCKYWKKIDCPLFKMNKCLDGCEKKIYLKDLVDHLCTANLSNLHVIKGLKEESLSLLNGKNVTLKLTDGSIYSGSMVNGKRHGVGILESADGSCFSGSWRNGLRHGHGSYRCHYLTYDGNWTSDRMFGHCYINRFSDGKYTGTCEEEGKYSGYGVMDYHNGSHYIGQWLNGFRHGHGIWKNPSASYIVLYEGEFLEGRRHGVGKSTRADGAIHEGLYAFDLYSGAGKLTLSPDDKYEGQFEQNCYDGKGILISKTEKYEGLFKLGRKHGFGNLEVYQVYSYRGDFENNERSGYGELMCTEFLYNGDFLFDLPHGKGEKTVEGVTLTGQFCEGSLVGVGLLKSAKYVYKGEIEDHLAHGKGTWQTLDESLCYKGALRHGEFHGHGELRNNIKKSIYTGCFEKGNYHGFGAINYECGGSYEGQFEKGLYEGHGILDCKKSNFIYSGAFRKGHLHGTVSMSWFEMETKKTKEVVFENGNMCA
jgi:hypothetical protein